MPQFWLTAWRRTGNKFQISSLYCQFVRSFEGAPAMYLSSRIFVVCEYKKVIP